MGDVLAIILSSTLAYLLGAIPFAYLVPKAFKDIDIRRVGSGNAGALNVYRATGMESGLLVFALDASKGLLVIYTVQWLGAPELAMYLAAVLVTVGHNWSPFLGFAGGKGVATVFGVSLAVLPWLTLVVLLFTVAALVLTRFITFSITAGFILLNVLTVVTAQPGGQVATCLFLTFLVVGTHFGRSAPTVITMTRQGNWRGLARLE